jgi:hypothetical protein
MHYQRYYLLLMCLLVLVGGCRHSAVTVVATVPEDGAKVHVAVGQ